MQDSNEDQTRRCSIKYSRLLSKISERSCECSSCGCSRSSSIERESSVTEPKEDKYGWVIVAACFFCIATIDGVGYTTGLLQNSLSMELGGAKSEVSFTGSLQVGVYSLTGPFVGRLVTEWGSRPVCIAGGIISCLGLVAASYARSLGAVFVGYSVITGVGFGMMYIPAVVSAAPFFHKRRALAIGISLCGSGVGTFTLAPLSEYILVSYGWRWVLRCMATLCLLCVFSGILMKPKDREDFEEETSNQNEQVDADVKSQAEQLRGIYRIIDQSIVDHPHISTFLLMTFSDFFAFFSIFIPYAFLPTFAMERQVPSSDAAFLISMGGICNTAGRVLGGWICDIPAIHPFSVMLGAVAVSGIPLLLIPRMSEYIIYLTLFSIFGFSSGVMVGSTSPLLVRLLGVASLSQTFGLVTAMRGIAALMGPPGAGFLVDFYSTSSVAIDLSGLLFLVSTVLCVLAIIRYRVTRKRAAYMQV